MIHKNFNQLIIIDVLFCNNMLVQSIIIAAVIYIIINPKTTTGMCDAVAAVAAVIVWNSTNKSNVIDLEIQEHHGYVPIDWFLL